jgi:hypothetical protein
VADRKPTSVSVSTYDMWAISVSSYVSQSLFEPECGASVPIQVRLKSDLELPRLLFSSPGKHRPRHRGNETQAIAAWRLQIMTAVGAGTAMNERP